MIQKDAAPLLGISDGDLALGGRGEDSNGTLHVVQTLYEMSHLSTGSGARLLR